MYNIKRRYVFLLLCVIQIVITLPNTSSGKTKVSTEEKYQSKEKKKGESKEENSIDIGKEKENLFSEDENINNKETKIKSNENSPVNKKESKIRSGEQDKSKTVGRS